MSFLQAFARLIGVPERAAEDALLSERAARLSLSRRGLLLGATALATGKAFGFARPSPNSLLVMVSAGDYRFGDGSDGDLYINDVFECTRPINFRNVTIGPQGLIKANGYRVLISGTLDLSEILPLDYSRRTSIMEMQSFEPSPGAS